MRLALPGASFLGAPSNDVRTALDAGVGDRPPRIDDEETAARLVAWLRLRPAAIQGAPVERMPLTWIGVNAVEIEQLQTITGRVVGQSDGTADQEIPLGAASVDADSLRLQVEEPGRGYVDWTRIDDLVLAGRDDAVFQLDSEAGAVRFGDAVRGRVPEPGARIRVAQMRAGGGAAGNVAAGTLEKISARDLSGAAVGQLVVAQKLAATGGGDAESLESAERRIPAMLRHRQRAAGKRAARSCAAHGRVVARLHCER